MSLALELVLWNAWTLLLPQMLVLIISDVIIKRRGQEHPRLTNKEKTISRITSFLFALIVIYSVFLPLKLDLVWFHIGFFVYLLGTIFYVMGNLAFATTSVDEPVTKGVYHISRRPMNFGMFLMLIGIGTACASWIFLTLAMAFMILMHIWLPSEERWCLDKYGNAYREYMNRTPRRIGIPKSRKN